MWKKEKHKKEGRFLTGCQIVWMSTQELTNSVANMKLHEMLSVTTDRRADNFLECLCRIIMGKSD